MNTVASSAAERSRAGRARAIILPAAVVVLLAAVALASRAPLRPPGATPIAVTPARGTLSPWTVALLGIGAATVLGGLALHLMWKPEFRTYPRFRVPKPLRIALVSCLFLLGVIVVASALQGDHRVKLFHIRGHLSAATGRGRVGGSGFSLPLWSQLSIGLLVLVAGILLVLTAGWRGRASNAPALPALEPKITDAVGRSLEDLEADPDARRAIIAAYRRMEESLAHAGFPRSESETAREYLSRGLFSLELSPSTIGTLTTLFERAKFSLHPVDLQHRDQAIAALSSLRQELA